MLNTSRRRISKMAEASVRAARSDEEIEVEDGEVQDVSEDVERLLLHGDDEEGTSVMDTQEAPEKSETSEVSADVAPEREGSEGSKPAETSGEEFRPAEEHSKKSRKSRKKRAKSKDTASVVPEEEKGEPSPQAPKKAVSKPKASSGSTKATAAESEVVPGPSPSKGKGKGKGTTKGRDRSADSVASERSTTSTASASGKTTRKPRKKGPVPKEFPRRSLERYEQLRGRQELRDELCGADILPIVPVDDRWTLPESEDESECFDDDLMDRYETERFPALRKKLFPVEGSASQTVYDNTQTKLEAVSQLWEPGNRCPFLVCRSKRLNLDGIRLYMTRQRFFRHLCEEHCPAVDQWECPYGSCRMRFDRRIELVRHMMRSNSHKMGGPAASAVADKIRTDNAVLTIANKSYGKMAHLSSGDFETCRMLSKTSRKRPGDRSSSESSSGTVKSGYRIPRIAGRRVTPASTASAPPPPTTSAWAEPPRKMSKSAEAPASAVPSTSTSSEPLSLPTQDVVDVLIHNAEGAVDAAARQVTQTLETALVTIRAEVKKALEPLREMQAVRSQLVQFNKLKSENTTLNSKVKFLTEELTTRDRRILELQSELHARSSELSALRTQVPPVPLVSDEAAQESETAEIVPGEITEQFGEPAEEMEGIEGATAAPVEPAGDRSLPTKLEFNALMLMVQGLTAKVAAITPQSPAASSYASTVTKPVVPPKPASTRREPKMTVLRKSAKPSAQAKTSPAKTAAVSGTGKLQVDAGEIDRGRTSSEEEGSTQSTLGEDKEEQ